MSPSLALPPVSLQSGGPARGDMTETVRVGIIGCGAISGAYLDYARRFPMLDIVAVSDLDAAKARAKAEEFGVPRVCGAEELLRDPSIEILLNLTIPAAHAAVSLTAIEAGKH